MQAYLSKPLFLAGDWKQGIWGPYQALHSNVFPHRLQKELFSLFWLLNESIWTISGTTIPHCLLTGQPQKLLLSEAKTAPPQKSPRDCWAAYHGQITSENTRPELRMCLTISFWFQRGERKTWRKAGGGANRLTAGSNPNLIQKTPPENSCRNRS